MTYSELKTWFDNWLSDLPDRPIPLNMEHSFSRDIRFTINVHFNYIENIPAEKRKTSAVSRASKTQLIRIKEAIEKGSHDISMYGYEENSNYKPNK